MPPFPKKPLTYEDQVSQLEARGLLIPRRREAKEVLATIGYTRLSSYWRHLLVPESNSQFSNGASFNQVYDRYQFDSRLRQMTLYAVNHIEIALRSGLAYEISHTKGTGLWTADLLTLKNPAWHSAFITKVLSALDDSTEAFARDYRRVYKSDYPIPPAWIALQFTSFGDLIQLFSQVKELQIRRTISARYNVNHDVLLSWMKSIRVLRNGCAHHARIWNRNLAVQPTWPKSLAKNGSWVESWQPAQSIEQSQFTKHRNLGDHQQNSLTFYSAACVMCYLIDQINPKNTFRARLFEATDYHPIEASIEAGFPINWKSEPLWTKEVKD